jgi:hypothetical protein
MADFGRPSLYDAAYCDQVVEWGTMGKSKAWMAAQLGISRETIYEWERTRLDFSDALTRAMALSQAWWEDAGQDNMISMPGQGSLNGSVYSRSMAARFPADWREKSETTLQGPDGGAVRIIATDHDEKL